MAKTKQLKIGDVGVDAGMLYIGDPCYIKEPIGTDDTWTKWLRALYHSSQDGSNAAFWQIDDITAVVTSTGWGDGIYPVYAEIRDGRVMSVTVKFEEDE